MECPTRPTRSPAPDSVRESSERLGGRLPLCRPTGPLSKDALPARLFSRRPQDSAPKQVYGFAPSLPTRTAALGSGGDHASAPGVPVLSLSCRSVIPTWAAPRRVPCRRPVGPLSPSTPEPRLSPARSAGPKAERGPASGSAKAAARTPVDLGVGVLPAVY